MRLLTRNKGTPSAFAQQLINALMPVFCHAIQTISLNVYVDLPKRAALRSLSTLLSLCVSPSHPLCHPLCVSPSHPLCHPPSVCVTFSLSVSPSISLFHLTYCATFSLSLSPYHSLCHLLTLRHFLTLCVTFPLSVCHIPSLCVTYCFILIFVVILWR